MGAEKVIIPKIKGSPAPLLPTEKVARPVKLLPKLQLITSTPLAIEKVKSVNCPVVEFIKPCKYPEVPEIWEDKNPDKFKSPEFA